MTEPMRGADEVLHELPSGRKVRAGDWVLVLGRVIESPRHPDDLSVEFFSHNEQWDGRILKSRIMDKHHPPVDWPSCTHLLAYGGSLVRCIQAAEHVGEHESETGVRWPTEQTVGYFEQR